MSSIIVDPEQVRLFRSQIAENVEELERKIPETEGHFDTVAQSWKDEQFKRFHSQFEKDMEMIRPLCQALHNYESNILYNYEKKLRVYTEF